MSKESKKEQIDLIEVAQTLWDSRRNSFRYLLAGLCFGLVVSIILPEDYISTATLMPEYNSESVGSASQLLEQYGGLLGISGGTYSSESNAIRVDLYPEIIQSLTFQSKLLDENFYYPEFDTTTTLFAYFNNLRKETFLNYLFRYTIGLPFELKKMFSDSGFDSKHSNNSGLIVLTREEMEVIKELRKRVRVTLNEENGIITIYVKMPDPNLSAEIASYTFQELTNYLIEYRTEKVSRDLDFVKEQLDKTKGRFKSIQIERAEFLDSNQGTLSARAQIEKERLESEYNIIYNLYNTLTQQFEQAKLKVQEETPVFKVLQPVQVPVDDNKSTLAIIFVFAFGAVLSSFAKIFYLNYIHT